MYGVDLRTWSRTMALWAAYFWTVARLWSPLAPAIPAAVWPRSYSAFVIFWNAFEPLPVNWRTTSGWPFWSRSAVIPDSTRSFPVSSGGPPGRSGKYLKRYQYVPVFETPFVPAPRQPFFCGHETARRFWGAARIFVSAGCLPPYGSSSWWRSLSGPWRSLWIVVVFCLVTFLPLTFVVIFFLTVVTLNR